MRDTTRTFPAQSDSGARHEITETIRYTLRDGREVVAEDGGLFRIVETGELLTPL
ncbi:hypothetical protein [Paenirhodobacter sp.]|uniref:hypothetical protein n=1 Tax=Paenirhodobacter sp. TaxID=1965326 RepID=UPI003B3E1E77